MGSVRSIFGSRTSRAGERAIKRSRTASRNTPDAICHAFWTVAGALPCAIRSATHASRSDGWTLPTGLSPRWGSTSELRYDRSHALGWTSGARPRPANHRSATVSNKHSPGPGVDPLASIEFDQLVVQPALGVDPAIERSRAPPSIGTLIPRPVPSVVTSVDCRPGHDTLPRVSVILFRRHYVVGPTQNSGGSGSMRSWIHRCTSRHR